MTSSSQHLEKQGEVAVIHCRGRIVLGETEELRSLALGAIEESGKVVLQLAKVKTVDSTGLGLLVFLCESARRRSGDVKLVAPSPELQDVLETTMLGRMFDVHPSEQSALAAFAKTVRGAAKPGA